MSTPHEAIRELGLRQDAAALKELADAAAARDQFLRRTALEVIGRHSLGRDLQALVLDALGDSSEYVVRTACDIVERWRLLEARERVLALLASPSAATRECAIRTLGAIWIDPDFSLIFGSYTKDSEIDVRREAASVLRRRAGPANWRTLFDAFHVDDLARHRRWACELAECFSGPEILPLLATLSVDIDGHVRKAASTAFQTVSSRAGPRK